jgi:hypothetical protein
MESELKECLHAMNWNELSELIDEATRILSEKEDQAIGALENAQHIMKEKRTRRFPDSEREALNRLLGFDGSYKEAYSVMAKFAEMDGIKHAVAAFSEGTIWPVTQEYNSLLSMLYKCNDGVTTQAWKDARERFWMEFEKASF